MPPSPVFLAINRKKTRISTTATNTVRNC